MPFDASPYDLPPLATPEDVANAVATARQALETRLEALEAKAHVHDVEPEPTPEPPPPPPQLPDEDVAPGDAILISPGQNYQVLINSQPNGASFRLAAGLFSGFSVVPKPGQKIYGTLDEDGVKATILDGNTVTNNAIFAHTLVPDCQVRSLRVTRYRCGDVTGWGAIGQGGSTRWVVSNIEAYENRRAGVSCGPEMLLKNSYLHHNHEYGFCTGGKADGLVVENCFVEANNYLKLFNWRGLIGGGSKIIHSKNVTVRQITAKNNWGSAIWFDNCVGGGNVVEDITGNMNEGPVVFFEISDGLIARRITSVDHGKLEWAQVYVANSQNTAFSELNLTGRGVLFSEDSGRGRELENGQVTNSRLAVVSQHGLQVQSGDSSLFNPSRFRFNNNTYPINPTATPFRWGGAKNWSQWQTLGQDANSQLA